MSGGNNDKWVPERSLNVKPKWSIYTVKVNYPVDNDNNNDHLPTIIPTLTIQRLLQSPVINLLSLHRGWPLPSLTSYSSSLSAGLHQQTHPELPHATGLASCSPPAGGIRSIHKVKWSTRGVCDPLPAVGGNRHKALDCGQFFILQFIGSQVNYNEELMLFFLPGFL